jgi:hypothetical protein
MPLCLSIDRGDELPVVRPLVIKRTPVRIIRRMLRAVPSMWLAFMWPGIATGGEDPASFVQFVQEPTAACLSRNAVQILVRNTHPSRTLQVWLDRYHMGHGTGDRSRSELKPGAEPEPLGCSRNLEAPQEWRLVRAVFVD